MSKSSLSKKIEYLQKWEKYPKTFFKDVLDIELTQNQIEIIEALENNNRIAVKSSNSSGKCQKHDENIVLANGSIVKAEELVGKEFDILSYDKDSKQQISKKARAEDNGVKECIEIRTQSGTKVQRTNNHLLYKKTFDNKNNWTRVDELKKGDLILVPNKIDIKPSKFNITETEQKLLDESIKNRKQLPNFVNLLPLEEIDKIITNLTLSFKPQKCNFIAKSKSKKFIEQIYFLSLRLGVRLLIKQDKDYYILELNNQIPDNYNAPEGFIWEEIKEINNIGYHKTVAIEVDDTHTYLTTVYDHNSFLMGGYVPYYFLMGIVSGSSTIVVISAPVFAQIRDGIFAHVKSNLKKADKRLSELFGQPGYKMFPKAPSEDVNRIMYHYDDNSFITGISTDKANAISGRHAERVLTIFDEAQGINEQVFSAFKGIWQSGKTKILAIGNPTLPDGNAGYFYNCFNDKSSYHKITISAFDTPNFLRTGIKLEDYFKPESDPSNWRNKLDRFAGTDFKKAKKLGRIGRWEDDVKDSFHPFTGLQNPISVYDILVEDGRNIDSYEFRTRVLGEFPATSSNALYQDDWIQQSVINYNDDSLWVKGEICIGIDTAKGIEGKDLTAFTISNGNKILEVIEENLDTRGILNKTNYLWNLYGAHVVKIEYQNSGLELSRLMKEDGINAVPVDVSSGVGFPKTKNYYLKQKTEELKKLYNVKRDELYCNIRNEINPNIQTDKPPLLLPPDRELIREMKAITYGKNHKGQIVVCKKDEVRARLGGDKSPNRLDSLLMCRAEVEYDPLANIHIDANALITIKRPSNMV